GAVSIFSVAITVATDVFMRAQRAQRQAAAFEKVQDATRFVMTRISQELLAGRIAYKCYDGSDATCNISDRNATGGGGRIVSDTLAVEGADGTVTLFTVRKENHTDYGEVCKKANPSASCLIIVRGNQHERMTPDGIAVQKLAFFITPDKDPLRVDTTLNDYPSDVQPKVTIMMTVRGDVPGIREPIDLSVQTTLSSRIYER
ncbi:MAG: hypothetical protein AAB855_02040, partial [Patescibacteria group bacterium]